MLESLLRRLRSFRHAFRGIGEVFRAEPNARVHLVAAITVIAAGVYFQLTLAEWCLIGLAIALVVIAETFNTAIETLCDRVTTENDEQIRRTKDLSAAAVLLAAIASVVIGILVFAPKAL